MFSRPAFFASVRLIAAAIPITRALPCSLSVAGGCSLNATNPYANQLVLDSSTTNTSAISSASSGFSSAAPSAKEDFGPSVSFWAPSMIFTLIAFTVFTAVLVTTFFFGREIKSWIIEKYKSNKTLQKIRDRRKVEGLGFGYDGLTKAQIKAYRSKEEQQAAQETVKGPWFTFIRLPARPPALYLRHGALLPPMQIPEGLKSRDEEEDAAPPPQYDDDSKSCWEKEKVMMDVISVKD